jgi:uncharacterized beta-barrel protein YwiB (DUF1934 family)
MISIKGIQRVDGQQDVVELLTRGHFYRRGNGYWLSYNESEATGFEGHRTTLHVEDRRVTMRRTGSTTSHLVIEPGSRHQCCYETGLGAFTVGISGGAIRSTLSDEGGEVDFSYDMDVNAALASENRVIIRVQAQGAPAPEH